MTKSTYQFLLFGVVAIVAVLLGVAWWGSQSGESGLPSSQSSDPVSVSETSTKDEGTMTQEENLFAVDSGVRATYASNPLVVEQTKSSLTLAYEHQSGQLKNAPQEKVRYIQTSDGVNFDPIELDVFEAPKPVPLQMPDGTYRRYVHRPELGGIIMQVSEDGETFTSDEELVYETGVIEGGQDPKIFGVSTYFVDSMGGVVLIYNVTLNNQIVVNRAYASPETNGTEFVLTHEDYLAHELEYVQFADPHTLVRENGDIWLVIMNGPKNRMQGEPANSLHLYVSRDDGKTFAHEGRIVGYEDFTEFDVYSLNDPKIVEFPDGSVRVYVAALVEDEVLQAGYRWDLVSATYKE